MLAGQSGRSVICASPLPAACYPCINPPASRDERRAAAPADSAGASYVFGEDPQRVAEAAGAVLPLAVLAPAEVLRCLVAEAVCDADKARASPLHDTPTSAGAGRFGRAKVLRVGALELRQRATKLSGHSLCACTVRLLLTALQAGSAHPGQS